MEICHPHNLNQPYTEARPFGIRVSLPPDDTFAGIIGTDWERLHWFSTEAERDRALEDMKRRHEYSRRGDYPSARFETLER
jgi:hypothetical protein